jgi:hypothetical protein
MLKNYKGLKVWQKSHQLCLEVYKITAKFAKADYIRSLCIAYGSNCQLETQLLLSADLGYIENGLDEIQPVEGMLKALIKTLANEHLNP